MKRSTKIARHILAATSFLIASAQSASAFELYASQGYRDGGEFDLIDSNVSVKLDAANSTSFTLAKAINDQKSFELLYSYQGTSLIMSPGNSTLFDLDVNYLHIGGTNLIKRNGATDIYASGGLGATYYSPKGGDYGSESRFSMSFGLGAKHAVGERIMLRLDGKLFGTLLNSGSGMFCGIGTGGSGCSIAVSGTLALQYEISAGIGIKF